MIPIILLMLTILAGIVNYLDRRKENKDKNKSSHFPLFTIILVICTAVASYWNSHIAQIEADTAKAQEKIEKQKGDSLNMQIDSLLKVNSKLQAYQFDTVRAIFDSSRKIISRVSLITMLQKKQAVALNKQIDTTQKILTIASESLNQLTGGGDLPHMSAQVEGSDRLSFVISKKGKYTLNNIKINITEQKILSDRVNERIINPEMIHPFVKTINVPALHPNEENALNVEYDFGKNKLHATFVVQVYWNNGSYIWFVTFRRQNGILKQIISHYSDIESGNDINW